MTSTEKNCGIDGAPSFPRLKLPPYGIRLRPGTSGKAYDVYDPIRGRWVALTPEEWVRQHFVNFLVEHRGYSVALIANEVTLKLNNTRRRADTVVYDRSLRPAVIVEYKAAEIPLTRLVAEQALRYNLVLDARAVIVTNGMDVYTLMREGAGFGVFRGVPPAGEVLT